MKFGFSDWSRRSPMAAKLVVIAIMIIGFMIPLDQVTSLVRERDARQMSAAADIETAWGGEQRVFGPLIRVPYGRSGAEPRYLTLAPSDLNIRLQMDTERRARGMFDAVVYNAKLQLSGAFEARPDLPVDGPVFWEQATLIIGLDNPRSLGPDVVAKWNGDDVPVKGRAGYPHATSPGLRMPVNMIEADAGQHRFEIALSLRGRERIHLYPLADKNTIQASSAWPSPGFGGGFLPQSHSISADGFTANWSVSRLALGYPAIWTDWNTVAVAAKYSAIEIRLVEPVQRYLSIERSVKYGVLFVSLTFLAFFLFEVVAGLRVHFIPYAMIGAALCLFYLALLALSEHIPFAVAYAIAATIVATMVGLYTRSLLNGWVPATLIAGLVAILYGVLYVLLMLERFSLLSGTSLLLGILGIGMYLTRKTDWYRLDSNENG